MPHIDGGFCVTHREGPPPESGRREPPDIMDVVGIHINIAVGNLEKYRSVVWGTVQDLLC